MINNSSVVTVGLQHSQWSGNDNDLVAIISTNFLINLAEKSR